MSKTAEISKNLFIKDLIRRVQVELMESQKEREQNGEPAIFEVEKMTIEVNFVAIESKKAEGGLDFKIIAVGGIDLGGSAGIQQQQIHKITLSLNAVSNQTVLRDLEESSSHFMPREE